MNISQLKAAHADVGARIPMPVVVLALLGGLVAHAEAMEAQVAGLVERIEEQERKHVEMKDAARSAIEAMAAFPPEMIDRVLSVIEEYDPANAQPCCPECQEQAEGPSMGQALEGLPPGPDGATGDTPATPGA